MAKADRGTQKRHVYKTMDSPVGRLTLVATDDGLAAILWENDRPRRVRLNIEAEDDSHPVLVETERQLEEYFAGRRKQFALTLDRRRHGLSTQGVERAADDPVRRNAIATDRSRRRSGTPRRARGRRRQRQKSGVDRRAVPSGHRIHGQPHGVRRRPRRQGTSAGIRVRSLARALCRLIASRAAW